MDQVIQAALAARERGPAPGKLDQPRVIKSLGMIHQGYGRQLAGAAVGVPHVTVRRMIRADPDLARRVREAEVNRVEACEADLFRMATRQYDSPTVLRAILAYLARRDEIDEARRALRDRPRRGRAGGGNPPAPAGLP